MTAQIMEWLILDGEQYRMCAEPLELYFARTGRRPKFAVRMTACWRGYHGEWEVVDNKLYLIRLSGRLEDGAAVSLKTLFPGCDEQVFASWYTGTVRVPQGKQLEYVHMGYESVYERELLLTFENGFLTATETRQNCDERPPAPEPRKSKGLLSRLVSWTR